MAMIACYGPNPAYMGAADDGSSSATTTGTDTTATGADLETSTSDPDTSDTTDTGDTTDTTDTTGNVDPTCEDGIADPGEFCFYHSELLVTYEVQALAAADFDGNGDLDIAVGRKDDLLVLLGDGTGGFPLQVDLPHTSGNYRGAAAGDLDGDQIADLVVANESVDRLFVYRSLGDGQFAEAVSFPTGDEPNRVRLADLDGDLHLDAVVTLEASNSIAVFLGDGTGGFSAPTNFPTNGDDPIELELGRFDANVGFDVAVANFEDMEIAILRDAGPGQFATPLVHELSGKPRSAQIADFNLDGAPDIAAVLEDRDRVEFLHGNGAGDVSDPVLSLQVGDRPVGALAHDLNGDVAVDLLILNFDDQSVGVLFNDPVSPGNFRGHETLVWFNGFANMTTIISADLNGDEVLDVVIGGHGVRAMLSDP